MSDDTNEMEMDVFAADPPGVANRRVRIVRFRMPEMQFQATIEATPGRLFLDQLRDEAIKAQLKMIQLVADAKVRGLE